MDFVPPKPSAPVIALGGFVLPAILRSRHVVAVEFSPPDVERLRSLRDERVALLPNHPTTTDPLVMYHLGRVVGQRFHFLCCIEAFRSLHGAWGWVLQHCGAYSIVRGLPDRKAFRMTRDILAGPATKLVAFPEGEVYSQNDSLLPFHSGLTQLLFWAHEDAQKAAPGARVLALPVAIRYRFVDDTSAAVLASLTRLEAAVGLPHGDGEAPYARLRRVGEAVVGKLESQYGVPEAKEAELGARMVALKQAIVARVAGALQARPPEGTLADTVRHLINALHQVTDEKPSGWCAYQRRLWEDERRRVQPLVCDLNRLSNWIAVYDGYVAEDPTPERTAETLRRLEIEVLGRPHCLGRQRCSVRLGEPISMADHYVSYRASKSATVDGLTRRFEDSIRSLLAQMR